MLAVQVSPRAGDKWPSPTSKAFLATAASTACRGSLRGLLVTPATKSLGHTAGEEAAAASWAAGWSGQPVEWCWNIAPGRRGWGPASLFLLPPCWSTRDLCLGPPAPCCNAGDPQELIFTRQEPSPCLPELLLWLPQVRLLLLASCSCGRPGLPPHGEHRSTRTHAETASHVARLSPSVRAPLTAACSRRRTPWQRLWRLLAEVRQKNCSPRG